MKYLAVSLEEGGEWDATVQADVGCDSLARSGRLARAMKAVLLAAKAWAKAATALEIAYERDVRVSAGAPIVQRHLDATKRLLAAQERLAQIEREVAK